MVWRECGIELNMKSATTKKNKVRVICVNKFMKNVGINFLFNNHCVISCIYQSK